MEIIKIEKQIEQEIIDHPKLDMLSLGIIFVIIAVAVIYFFRAPIPRTIPHSLLLQVPFSPQAPTNNWSRNEDCEETSITMANAFVGGNLSTKLPARATQEAINNLKKWEQANLGYNANTGVDATTKMAEGAFGLKITQLPNYSEEDLKRALMDNRPILLSINAKLLRTAQYSGVGPTYHMIVVRGFRGDTFIVNDPGTNNGNSNEYSFSDLKNAAADWNEATKSIDANKKVALIVSK